MPATPFNIAAPYLFFAPLLQMLFHVAANQFLVVKKTWPNMLILPIGAIANIAINVIMIPILGIEGASLATLTGYILADIICVIVLCYMKLMVISRRFLIAVLLMTAYFSVWRITFSNNLLEGTIAALLFTAMMTLLYRRDIELLLNSLRGRKVISDET